MIVDKPRSEAGMNRQKKIKQIQNKRAKQHGAKLNTGAKSKPRYISKAERAKIAAAEDATLESGSVEE